jgi:hypothetical protein
MAVRRNGSADELIQKTDNNHHRLLTDQGNDNGFESHTRFEAVKPARQRSPMTTMRGSLPRDAPAA